MTAHLIVLGVLVVMGLLWLFVNIKARGGFLRFVSFVAMCGFLIAASVAAVQLVLEVLA